MLKADLSNKQVGYSVIKKSENDTQELLVKIDSLLDAIGEGFV